MSSKDRLLAPGIPPGTSAAIAYDRRSAVFARWMIVLVIGAGMGLGGAAFFMRLI